MKFIASLFACLLCLPVFAETAAPAAQPPAALEGVASIAARSWVLYDFQSNQILAAQNSDARVEPASLTKLMTAYLTFSALKNKKLDLKQVVPISKNAWKPEGSNMFIEPRMKVTVDELLHGMIIQSGNDASIALAEALGGTEDVFAQMMNKEAQRMGLTNTHFTNSTGLPNAQHYSTARDLSLLAAAIIRDFPDFYPLYSVREYTFNNIKQANRNRLLGLDPTMDGMKTGHTESAGFCLIGSSKRGTRRLISVVTGTASDNARTAESQKLLNYGFQFYDTQQLYKKDQEVSSLPIYKGSKNTLKAGFTDDVFFSLPKEQFAKLKANLVSSQPLLAPLKQGDKVGVMQLNVDGKTVAELPVLALEEVAIAGIFGRAWDSIRLLWK
ncbi:MAG: D-alanyl-D-alanine carboxypeptidase family protein [Burkholderiales bacterium]